MKFRYLLAFLCLPLLSACDDGPREPPEEFQLVRVAQAREGRLRHRLSFHGVLEPVTRARLAFQSPGVLSSRPAQMGQAVRKGELLATLDNPELAPAQRSATARLQESMTQRDQAERDLARLRALQETGAVGDEQVEQKAAELSSLQASVARAEADLAGSRQRLEDATLVAPFDGVISMVGVFGTMETRETSLANSSQPASRSWRSAAWTGSRSRSCCRPRWSENCPTAPRSRSGFPSWATSNGRVW